MNLNGDYIERDYVISEVKKAVALGLDPVECVECMPFLKIDRQFEYHYDHTDCVWYLDGRGSCPGKCSQYRDGWNDAMMYIFKDGAGYRPYVRGEKYGQ